MTPKEPNGQAQHIAQSDGGVRQLHSLRSLTILFKVFKDVQPPSAPSIRCPHAHKCRQSTSNALGPIKTQTPLPSEFTTYTAGKPCFHMCLIFSRLAEPTFALQTWLGLHLTWTAMESMNTHRPHSTHLWQQQQANLSLLQWTRSIRRFWQRSGTSYSMLYVFDTSPHRVHLLQELLRLPCMID